MLFRSKKKAEKAQPQRDSVTRIGGGSDLPKDTQFEAVERTSLPLSPWMIRLMAQELPILDSSSRQRVNQILREWEGSTISSVEELPEEIRELMELN